MIRACLLLLAGGYAAQLSRLLPDSDLCSLLFVASIVLLCLRRLRAAGWMLLGLALFLQAGSAIVADRLLPDYAGDSLLTRVRILDFPRHTPQSVVLLVAPLADRRLPPRSRISWFQPSEVPAIGEIWQFEIRLKRPRSYSNPGVFDGEAWLFREKIHATGYVVEGKRNRKLGNGTPGFLNSLRAQFVARASAATASADIAAVVVAIGVGARHLISREQWSDYARSGTSHLMAISGLHVGLAASFAYLLARLLLGLLRVPGNLHAVAVACGVVLAAAYTAVSGLGIPAQRAALMLLVGALALLRRRHVQPVSVLAFAAMVVFVRDPVAAMAPGFSLSFSAVLLLIWLARREAGRPRSRRLAARLAEGLRQLLVVQVFLFFGLMPLCAVLFQRVAWLATPVNLVAVPLFSAITVPFTLIALCVGEWLEFPGDAALRVAMTSIEWLHTLIRLLTHLPLADLTLAAISGWAWPLAVLPCAWALLPKGWPGRWIAPLALAALILHAPRPPAYGCLDAHVLDVGQGLSVVVETNRGTLVFDTGARFPSGGSVAEQVVVPFLAAKRIRRIDWLVVSHDDIDHSGGVQTLLDYANVDALLAGERLRGIRREVLPCRAGQHWVVDGVRFRMLHPTGAGLQDGNDASCVLLVSTGAHALLLTGDIEVEAERAILTREVLGTMDALVVPHHGSLTSSSVPFVETTSPRLAIVSAGFANRWGFPKARVVERWRAAGAEVLNTATSGAVSLRLCASGGVQGLRLDRDERRRFWREGAR
ncbi:MAG: DNA internalization-related competence protein ComEC/Rec2 [Woeseiaceae bacterium]|nr:DNA internalization-related competence protein ComEC/Rec2 [Woeseiaceae bacterium]